MTRLRQELPIDCPYHFARSYLEEALKPLATSGQQRVILLSVPVGDRKISKEANAEFSVAVDPKHFDEPWTVHWEAKSGGPYPTFDGTLAVRADETYDRSVLELDGQYAPPLGAAGAAFDAVIGKRIAELTARELLERLGASMVARHGAEESRKTGGA